MWKSIATQEGRACASSLRHCCSVFCLVDPIEAAANLTCGTATTLDALATCIRNQMPASGSNGYVAPTLAQQNDWRTAVRQMLDGSCDATLPAGLQGILRRRVRSSTPATAEPTAC